MITLDASVVIAHLSPADRHHEAATRLLEAAADVDVFHMHPLNLAEVLVGGVRVGRGVEMLDDLRAIGIEVTPYSEDEPLRLANLRATTGLRMPDCCALDTALRTDSTLATFDAALAAAAREVGVNVLGHDDSPDGGRHSA